MDKSVFAKKLKDARTEAGYTQAAVAELINRPQPTIGAWEVGRSQPDMDTLATLLRLYHMSANQFFEYDSSQKESLTPIEREHIKKYRTLDEHGKDMVDMVLDKEYERVAGYDSGEAYQYAAARGNSRVKIPVQDNDDDLPENDTIIDGL